MIYVVIIILAIISAVMALWSLKQQSKLVELKKAKKNLSRKRVIYDASAT